MLIDGYPYKSLSKQNNSAQSFLDESSKSGAGFKSLLDVVDAQPPSLVVCENVNVMNHKRQHFGGEKPIQIQQEEFDKRGYQGFFWTLNSKHFGLRQCRTRVYSIYIKKIEVAERLLVWTSCFFLYIFYFFLFLNHSLLFLIHCNLFLSHLRYCLLGCPRKFWTPSSADFFQLPSSLTSLAALLPLRTRPASLVSTLERNGRVALKSAASSWERTLDRPVSACVIIVYTL